MLVSRAAWRPRRLLAVAVWATIGAIAAGASCPQNLTPAAPLPLPLTADPPKEQEIRASVVAGGGVGGKRGFGGAALRGSYAPKPGMIVGLELGSAGSMSDPPDPDGETEVFTAVGTRILVGYAGYAFRRTLSLAGEIGLTTGLFNALGIFVGLDGTFSMTVGGAKWWSLTLGYRLAYVLPSSAESWSKALYHLAGVTLLIPRRSRYAFAFQGGTFYGHGADGSGKSVLGFASTVGFRFTYGFVERK